MNIILKIFEQTLMDPVKREIEMQKRRWEENVRRLNEEKERKELERKKL